MGGVEGGGGLGSVSGELGDPSRPQVGGAFCGEVFCNATLPGEGRCGIGRTGVESAASAGENGAGVAALGRAATGVYEVVASPGVDTGAEGASVVEA